LSLGSDTTVIELPSYGDLYVPMRVLSSTLQRPRLEQIRRIELHQDQSRNPPERLTTVHKL
jgi:hypothetical protein